jgi:hypothetical protein
MSKFIDGFTTNSTVLGYLAKSLGRQDSTDNALVLKYSSIVFHDKNRDYRFSNRNYSRTMKPNVVIVCHCARILHVVCVHRPSNILDCKSDILRL